MDGFIFKNLVVWQKAMELTKPDIQSPKLDIESPKSDIGSFKTYIESPETPIPESVMRLKGKLRTHTGKIFRSTIGRQYFKRSDVMVWTGLSHFHDKGHYIQPNICRAVRIAADNDALIAALKEIG